MHGNIIVKEPVVNEGLFNLVGEEGPNSGFKEGRILQFDEEVEFMRGVI